MTVIPGNQYLVPWLWGITTVGINVDKLKAALGDLPMPDNAWDLVFKPEYISKAKSCGVSMLDSADELFPAALRYLGKPPYSRNPSDYQEAAKLLKSIRPYITLFSSSGYINDMAAGSLCVAVGWNGDISIARAAPWKPRTGTRSRCCCQRPVPSCSLTRWPFRPMPSTWKTPTSGSATSIVLKSTPAW